jgi:sulfite reductase (ferredoxin)
MPRPSSAVGQGQWALGHREPLNPSEQMKKDDDGLAVRQRIVDVYAKRGFSSIDPTDLRGRFRWWGLYTQRKQGISGRETSVLDAAELEDEHFMLRIRVPGGRLDAAQLRTIGELSTRYGRDSADLTDRQNVQLHWVRIEDVPAIWDALDAVGLSTTEACGDTPRNMLGCPLAGVAADEVLDATPALLATDRRFVGDPRFSNLPRKYKTAMSGCARQCVPHEINDVSFVGVVHPETGRSGFDLWVGGGLSTNPMLAVRLDAFVEPVQVPEVWAAVTGLFRDYGYRRLRNRARMKFLVADWGVERFREVLEKEFLGWALPDGPAPAPPPDGARDHVGVHRQHDGRHYVGVVPRAGRVSGSLLTAVAGLAERYGSGRIRTTAEQKLVLLDVSEPSVGPLLTELDEVDLVARPSAFRRGTMACTGLEYCKLAIVETKVRAVDLYRELDARLPGFDVPVSINVNGCPNSCARFQLADIGLKGCLVGGREGFQVHLGGSLGSEPGFGRKQRGLKVTADELPDYVERLLRRYLDDRSPGEAFAAWARRAPEEALR